MAATDSPPDPSAAPPPTFDVLPLSAEVKHAVDDLGYVHPTPVQRAVFEPAARGADLVVHARTGTGKTAAYGLPLVDSLIKRNKAAVQALILCPTRELALQVARELQALAKYREVKVAAIYGGAPMPAQVAAIREGAQILAGTPGRVLDHLRRKTLDPSTIRSVVLDESDEMLSMGFLPQIDEILSFLPSARQTLQFSATLPPDIRRLAETRQKTPEFITLSGDHVGALEITHINYLTRGDKLAELLQIIEVEDPESAIVFCNTRDETKRVAALLEQQGFAADWLNADLSQNEREQVMQATREGKLRFLVATDVAARGIDISHLTHVINFDFPASADAYVHRTGRTGRAGKTGTAISLIAPSDIGNLYMLRLTYKIRPLEKQLPTARELKTRAETDLVQMFVDLYEARPAHPDDLALARRLLSHDRAERVVAGLLRDHLGLRADAPEEAAAARRSRAPRPARASAGEVDARANGERRRRRSRSSEARPERPMARVTEDSRPTSLAAEAPRDALPGAPAVEAPERAERAAPEPASSPEPGSPIRPTERCAEVFVNIGQRDGARPSDLQSILAERAGIAADQLDYVRVRPRHSFVGVRRELLDRVIDALNGAEIAGKQALAEEARRPAERS